MLKDKLLNFIERKNNEKIYNNFNYFFISLPSYSENHVVTYGTKSPDTKINIKIYSSLTCPYCAELHIKFLPSLTKKYVENKVAYIELHDYPLDQGGPIAAQLQKCFTLEQQKIS